MKRVNYNRVCPGCNERYHIADRTPDNVVEVQRCDECSVLSITQDGRRKIRKRERQKDGTIIEKIQVAF